jgi:RsiW-degrading membrane proteinase PrsW (M82 family)
MAEFLLAPESNEEIYAYRHEWRSVVIEGSILFVITSAFYVLVALIGVSIPLSLQPIIRIGFALFPLFLWLVFSFYTERFAARPRSKLLVVVVVTALAANAVAIPLINEYLQIDRWLPLSSAIDRIIGYTFTVGVVQELTKYLVIRYLVWPDQFQTQLDGVAYGAASAIGYITVVNLRFATEGSPSIDVVALQIFSVYAMNLAASIVIGYGLSEVRFSNPNPLFLTFNFGLAMILNGIAIPIRAGLVNAPFSLEIANPRLFFGLAFSGVLFAAPLLITAFLFSNSERRAREIAASRES